jgi:hypothetical protein
MLNVNSTDNFETGAIMNPSSELNVGLKTLYEFECYDKNGNLKWKDSFFNTVVTAGKDKLLDATIKTGLASPAWYVGLKGTGTVDVAHTMASHAAWSTITPYSNATDPAFTPGTISSGSVNNSASKAVFNIDSTSTVYGAFLKDNNTKGGATGTLYGGGDFTAQRGVASGDTLNVTITLTIT